MSERVMPAQLILHARHPSEWLSFVISRAQDMKLCNHAGWFVNSFVRMSSE